MIVKIQLELLTSRERWDALNGLSLAAQPRKCLVYDEKHKFLIEFEDAPDFVRERMQNRAKAFFEATVQTPGGLLTLGTEVPDPGW
jgi:hypothetical protein